MSLQEERDHLVTGLALRQPRRRTVITPRLASIPKSFIKSVFVFVNLVQPSVTSRANARHIVLPEQIQSSIYPGAAFSSNLVRRLVHAQYNSNLVRSRTWLKYYDTLCEAQAAAEALP